MDAEQDTGTSEETRSGWFPVNLKAHYVSSLSSYCGIGLTKGDMRLLNGYEVDLSKGMPVCDICHIAWLREQPL